VFCPSHFRTSKECDEDLRDRRNGQVALECKLKKIRARRKCRPIFRALFLAEAVARQNVCPPEGIPLHGGGLRHQNPTSDLAGRRGYLFGQLARRDHGVLGGGRIVHLVKRCVHPADDLVPREIDATIELLGRSCLLVMPCFPIGLPVEGSRDPEVAQCTLARGRRGRDGRLSERPAVSSHVHVDFGPAALQVVQLLVESLQLRWTQQDTLVVVEGVQAIIWT